MTIRIDGIVRQHYSDSDECLCCDGRHSFTTTIEGAPSSIEAWTSDQIRALADGTPVRISLEVLSYD